MRNVIKRRIFTYRVFWRYRFLFNSGKTFLGLVLRFEFRPTLKHKRGGGRFPSDTVKRCIYTIAFLHAGPHSRQQVARFLFKREYQILFQKKRKRKKKRRRTTKNLNWQASLKFWACTFFVYCYPNLPFESLPKCRYDLGCLQSVVTWLQREWGNFFWCTTGALYKTTLARLQFHYKKKNSHRASQDSTCFHKNRPKGLDSFFHHFHQFGCTPQFGPPWFLSYLKQVQTSRC